MKQSIKNLIGYGCPISLPDDLLAPARQLRTYAYRSRVKNALIYEIVLLIHGVCTGNSWANIAHHNMDRNPISLS